MSCETVFLFFRVWLIQQRIPSLLAHVNCRVYTRLPSLNPRHELIAPFINHSIYIELAHNEGYYIVTSRLTLDRHCTSTSSLFISRMSINCFFNTIS